MLSGTNSAVSPIMANDEDGPGLIGHGQLVLHLCQDNGIYIPVEEETISGYKTVKKKEYCQKNRDYPLSNS